LTGKGLEISLSGNNAAGRGINVKWQSPNKKSNPNVKHNKNVCHFDPEASGEKS
jgi:hypothetical protein